jgi:hypothetical protein
MESKLFFKENTLRKILPFLLFSLSAALAFAQSGLSGDYVAEMVFDSDEWRFSFFDNGKVDITSSDSTVHADCLSLQGGKYIELIMDGEDKMDFRVQREGENVSLFLVPDSNPEVLSSFEKVMDLPDDANGLTKEFGAKFREKLMELFDEIPVLKLRRPEA